MANKKLQTLTIGGVSMDASFLITPADCVDASATNVPLPNNAFVTVDLAVAPKTGFFVGYMYANFAAAAGGQRYLHFMRDDVELAGAKVDQTANTTTHLDIPVYNYVQAGQKLQAYVLQNSGSAKTLNRVTISGFIMDALL